ncbi:hypothetical protein SAMN05444487_11198 [Marininema mesophilum]|uniref:Winged helix-turn-helix domain-containing protein n=1 Tax=Marininema mesophilum TaxID=1048340 RepID=A0A1H2ZL09_9BACL|nr:crosslink repair DNA glycosylase YcaQ family protein [Marininema mesophilum]SDX17638.1 hypothetical protein SAMN05444487_11198 [Marininema mesophilum]
MTQLSPFSVSRATLRRFLLDFQQLPTIQSSEKRGPDDVLAMINKLECVQVDAVSVVEKNQHLVMAARLPGYRPLLLNDLLANGQVFEYWANAACVIPMEDYPLLEPIRKRRKEHLQPHLDSYASVAQEVLALVEKEGPLPSRAFQSTVRVHGYWDNKDAKTKATSHVLNLLTDSGILRVVRREGNERFFDLSERTIPPNLLRKSVEMEVGDAEQGLIDKYLRAYRIFDPTDARFGWLKMSALKRKEAIQKKVKEGSVIPLAVEEVRRPYFILAEDLDQLENYEKMREDQSEEESIRFLPPLDNVLWRRERIADLFDFHYRWEIYTPRVKRKYGSFAMPILEGTRFIGRMDPSLDRLGKQLNVRLLQLEPTVTMTPSLKKRLGQALDVFAQFHEVSKVLIEKTEGCSSPI